jgi:hypothetical protein
MIKRLETSGTKADCVRDMETFIKLDVGIQKPKYQQFIHVIEHLASGFLGEAQNSIVLEIDMETRSFSFQATEISN